MSKRVLRITIITLVFCSLFLTMGFKKYSNVPKEVYRVYLGGESLGLTKSKKDLESYIDKKQQALKEKYDVKKVYAPDNLSIVKEITYNEEIISKEKIYKKIENLSPFTIKGYEITIKGLTKQDDKKKKVQLPDVKIYVLDKSIFRSAVESTVKSFISKEKYEAYMNDTQKEIENTGSIIENLYIKNKIVIQEKKIPSTNTIYLSKEDVSKFIMFGTTEEQKKYVVKNGDTISTVAFNNKISNEEFLIANPKFNDENSLLYPGQVVTLGMLKPQFEVIEEDHAVVIQEKNFETETRYDNSKTVGYTEIRQNGIKGKNRVTQKIQKVNGETTNVVPVNTEVLSEPVKQVVIKGGKAESYYGPSGYGNLVATRGQWGWPASCSTISSGFGWRWGTLHDGTDISGCGHGSNIFAAQAGTVEISGYKSMNGEYIVINHHNGYYTLYAHMSSRYVATGAHVTKGQVIGGMGRTGLATGVHLHYAVWIGGMPYYGGRVINAMSLY